LAPTPKWNASRSPRLPFVTTQKARRAPEWRASRCTADY
jgi:hypothetical protein